MPSEIRQKLLKDVSQMRFDEKENLIAVLIAMANLENQGIPQTSRAIYESLFGMISEPTIRDWRRWAVYNYGIVEPPKGFEDPESWDGQKDLLFKIHLERIPPEIRDARASDHVLRKQFDEAVATKAFAYDKDGNIVINFPEFFKKLDEKVGADEFIEKLISNARKEAQLQGKNIDIDKQMFTDLVDQQPIITDYELHRYPFRTIAPPPKPIQAAKPTQPNFFSRLQNKIRYILKSITNL